MTTKDSRDQKKVDQAAESTPSHRTPEAVVVELKDEAKKLENDIHTLLGLISNRNPNRVKTLQEENEKLKARLEPLEKALINLYYDSLGIRVPEDYKLSYDALNKAAVDYFKKINLDPAIWKSIVS